MLQLGQIDRADDKPPYRQIAIMLRDAISSGQFRAGERLPSEWALTDHLGVARMTVRRAVDELRTEGLLIPNTAAECSFAPRRQCTESPPIASPVNQRRPKNRTTHRISTASP